MSDNKRTLLRSIAAGIAVGAVAITVVLLLVLPKETVPSETAGIESPTGDPDEWTRLRERWPDLAAWVTVEGTSIDSPVMKAPDDDSEFYLDHGPDREEDSIGCPYIDPRTTADGPYTIVYAHRAWGTNGFSEISDAHTQETFDGIGDCVWSTPDGGVKRLRKLCSARVPADDATTQTFEWSSDLARRLWVGTVVRNASVKVDGAEDFANHARKTVTLVTCSEREPGQPWRCVTTFAEVD